MNPISEILKLFKEGKILQQWEMYVLGNTELPRRAQTLDDNAVKDMIDKTLAECSILCGEVNKFLQYADFLLGKVQEVAKQDNHEKEKTVKEMQIIPNVEMLNVYGVQLTRYAKRVSTGSPM